MNPLPMPGEPWGWCVVTSEGFRALFIDKATADKYAANTHGWIVALDPRLEASDAKPALAD